MHEDQPKADENIVHLPFGASPGGGDSQPLMPDAEMDPREVQIGRCSVHPISRSQASRINAVANFVLYASSGSSLEKNVLREQVASLLADPGTTTTPIAVPL